MIDADTVSQLFPFSVQCSPDLKIQQLGRALYKRIPDAIGRDFSDVFDVQRLDADFGVDWVENRTGRPLLVSVKPLGFTLNGSFERTGDGILLLGGPRV